MMAQTSIPASPKVKEAIDLGIINPTSDEEMLKMNTTAEKLVWIEQVKGTPNPTSEFQLIKHTGEAKLLSLSELENINPLLFQLPQQHNRCENLLVKTTDGSYHILVVRSETMMANEIKRATAKKK
jgi:hypothetical protein